MGPGGLKSGGAGPAAPPTPSPHEDTLIFQVVGFPGGLTCRRRPGPVPGSLAAPPDPPVVWDHSSHHLENFNFQTKSPEEAPSFRNPARLIFRSRHPSIPWEATAGAAHFFQLCPGTFSECCVCGCPIQRWRRRVTFMWKDTKLKRKTVV